MAPSPRNALASLRVVTRCACLGLTLLATHPAFATDEPADLIGTEAVIHSVKQALVVAQSELDAEDLPPIKSAILQLDTIYSPRGDGRDELVIVKAGSEFDRTRIQKLLIDVKPPRARTSPISARELEETLAQAVVAAARTSSLISSEPNPLTLNGATVHLRFVVLKAGAGGLGFALTPVAHALDIAVDQAAVQILTIGYGPR